MPDISPVRLDVFKDAIFGAVQDIMGAGFEFVWSDQDAPRPPRPYILGKILAGPRRVGGAVHDVKQMRSAPTSVSATVATAIDERLYRLRVNGRPFDETATALSTVDTIRDALAALINASSTPATVTSGGAGEAILTPNFPGAILSVDGVQAADWTLVPSGEALVIDHASTRQIVVQFDSIVGEGIAEFGENDVGTYAIDLITTLEAGFELTEIRESLSSNHRVSVWGPAGEPLNLTGVTTVKNEGRATLDMVFVFAALRTRPTSVIEQAEVTADISGNTFTEVVP